MNGSFCNISDRRTPLSTNLHGLSSHFDHSFLHNLIGDVVVKLLQILVWGLGAHTSLPIYLIAEIKRGILILITHIE